LSDPVSDYDAPYFDRREACGRPLSEVRAVFTACAGRKSVLDLGCGQGRDALMAARLGHTVLGVDLSAVGITQMQRQAQAEGLDLRGRVADLTRFRTGRRFDVVVLDRVLHLLADDDVRRATLRRLSSLTRPGSFVIVVDVWKHRRLIRGFFERHQDEWRIVRRSGDFLCAGRTSGRAGKSGRRERSCARG
jgi:2-polyprenyl-3-methyl-5-hydroxy-6-metoxy-1,4-benzoquinol methylase